MMNREIASSSSSTSSSSEQVSKASSSRTAKVLNYVLTVFCSFVVVIIVGILALIVWISPRFNPSLYERMLFDPEPMTKAEYTAPQVLKPELVTIDSTDGVKLAGWFYKFSDAGKTVLVNHGKGRNIGPLKVAVQVLKECGAGSVLVYDYRGYGMSTGKATLRGVCDDALAAYDYLNKVRSIPTADIVINGGSLGTGVACYIAEHRPVGGIILECGFASLRERMQELTPASNIFPEFLYPEHGVDNRHVLRSKHAPVIIFHGMNDEMFPYTQAVHLYESASEPKELRLYYDSGHESVWHKHRADYVKRLGSFFHKQAP